MFSIQGLVVLVVQLIILGVVFSLLWWLIDQAGLPQPFAKAARVVLACVAVLIVCGLLLGLTGGPALIRW